MEPGMRARLRRAVVLALSIVVAGAGMVASAPAASAAAPRLTIDLTAVTVTGTGPNALVQVQATVSNTSDAPVYGARVGILRSRDPITELDALQQAVGPNPPKGFLLTDSISKITEQTVPFQPGATAAVTLSATFAQLGFDFPGAAYSIGIRGLGSNSANDSYYPEIGVARTVLALPATSVPVTRLILLTAAPTKLTSNVFRNDELATELAGPLDTLLSAAAAPGNSWLIDPALLDEVTDMANGYQVRREGQLVAGAGQSVAAAWLARFGQLNQANGARSLFANPDVAGAAAAGDDAVLTRALAAGATVTSISTLPLVILPTAAVHTDALKTYLAPSGAKAVLATNVATAGAWQPSAALPVLAASNEFASDVDLTDLQRSQLMEAEAVVAGAAGQLRLIRDASDLAADTASTSTWMLPRGLSDLLQQVRTGAEAELLPASVPILDKAQFTRIDDLERDFAAYGQLVPESSVTSEAAAVLTRAASSAWIGDRTGYDAVIDAIDDLVGPETLAKAVTVDASPRFVMSSRTNQFPVTLTNNLDEPIRLKVVVETDNPQRVRVPDTALITIAPGQSETVNVRPEASGNAVVRAQAYAATESGHWVTRATNITIEVTDLGFIGWLIVLGSGGVLVLATTLRILQVRRKNSTAGTEVANG